MRKLVVSEFMSLDGVVENPGWTFQFGSPDQEQFKYDELKAADALLLGRVTYEGFAAAWPRMLEQTGDFGARMNAYPKYVVSTTLAKATWNNSHVVKGDIAEGIRQLKAEPGRDILVGGSATLVRWLLQQSLVDELALLVFPIVLGRGKRLFDHVAETKWLLERSNAFASGVVALTYSSNH
jgi:dihydrofolate reductase